MLPSFDRLRELYPANGFGIYALEPGGPVTLEIYEGDEIVYRTEAGSLEAAFAAAFPPAPPPDIFA